MGHCSKDESFNYKMQCSIFFFFFYLFSPQELKGKNQRTEQTQEGNMKYVWYGLSVRF